MSRSDSRHVSCAKAITRNTSAQESSLTPASPRCRSMSREKLFHGTNSMTWANKVLPRFTLHSRWLKARSIAKTQTRIQIVDTPQPPETRIWNAFQPNYYQIYRTLLILNGRLRIKLISNSATNCGCGSDVIATSEARANNRGATGPQCAAASLVGRENGFRTTPPRPVSAIKQAR